MIEFKGRFSNLERYDDGLVDIYCCPFCSDQPVPECWICTTCKRLSVELSCVDSLFCQYAGQFWRIRKKEKKGWVALFPTNTGRPRNSSPVLVPRQTRIAPAQRVRIMSDGRERFEIIPIKP